MGVIQVLEMLEGVVRPSEIESLVFILNGALP